MSRRKKIWLLAATSLAIATVALLWPRPNWPAREALDEWRGLVDVQVAASSDVEMKRIADGSDLWFEIDTRVLKLCLNDATAGLFSKARERPKAVHGVVRSQDIDRLIPRLQELNVLGVLAHVHIFTQPGQESFVAGGPNGPVLVQSPTTWNVTVRPQFGRDGAWCCEAALELSRLADKEAPKFDTVSSGKIAVWLHPGETLIIGGLTHGAKAPKTLKAPLLYDLPKIGAWFSWTYTREVDEEWIVLITASVKPAVHTP